MKRPAIDPADVEGRFGAGFPAEFQAPFEAREKKALGVALGLTQFGVNLVTLPPGSASAPRHWHANEDEFVYILEGTPTMITETGRQDLSPGMVAGFKAGVEDAHHMVNESDADVVYIEIGSRAADEVCTLPDVDLSVRREAGQMKFLHKDGTPYPSGEGS